MIKKAILLLLALSLLLALLAACQPSPDPDPTFSALELATAISNAAADAPDTPERFDSSSPETLNAYIEAAYGLSAGEWEDSAVIMASGARAYEITVLRFVDEAAAKHGAECLEQYASSREGDFFGYAPEQAALVSSAVVCREGLYAGLFICEAPEAARELFISILNTGILPEPMPTMEPTPTSEPEPGAGPLVDMLRLMVGIMESCIDEIDALNGVSRITSFNEYMADRFYEKVTADFGVEADSVEAGFFVDNYYNAEEVFAIHVLYMSDEAAAGQALDGMRRYRASEESFYLEQEQPQMAERMAKGLELQNGRYAAQFVGADPEAMAAAFEAELERLETEQLPEPATVSQPVLRGDALRELKDRFRTLCQDDVDATDNWGWSDQGGIISSKYGISEDQFISVLYMNGSYDGPHNLSYDAGPDGDAFELAVLCMADETAAIRNMAAFQLRVWTIFWQFKTGTNGMFDPPETVRADYRIVRDGRYLALFICRDPEAVAAEFEAVLSELLSAAPEDKEDDPPHGTAEAPLLIEVEWAELEGDPDPDYPGRFLYKPVDEPYMVRYDTSRILAAWERHAPSGLSDYDCAIYDSAAAVLGELLRESMSDVEKEIVIYDWVLQNLTYDWTHGSVLHETPETSYTPYGGLVEHTGVCLGYASTFELLMDMAGVECITVIGAGVNSTEAHAWNMVCLDSEWYCVDLTWDKDRPRWEWGFFNVTSEYMVCSNHQWDYANVPEATATDHGLAPTS